jgi:membrane associated rhomboid family serine protease
MDYKGYSEEYRVGADTGMPKSIKWLLIANVAIFLAELFDKSSVIISLFGLTPHDVVSRGFVFQAATYMFLHSPSSLLHILFNMLMLWMFGSELARIWGTRRFLQFYLLTGFIAGAFSVFVMPGSSIPIVGASGAVLGILVAFAVLWPDRKVLLYFLIPIKVKYLIMIVVAIDLIYAFARPGDSVAHWTHLGGAIFGFAYMKRPVAVEFVRGRLLSVRRRKQIRKVAKEQHESEQLMDEVDRVLDRINEVGINNLTEKERRTLERASSHLSKKRR